MIVIIAGSRTVNDYDKVLQAIKDSKFSISQVISGGASGVDKLGERYARENNIPVQIIPYPSKYGKRGGPIRNAQMAKLADALIAIWDGNSAGTRSMLREAQKQKLLIYKHIV